MDSQQENQIDFQGQIKQEEEIQFQEEQHQQQQQQDIQPALNFWECLQAGETEIAMIHKLENVNQLSKDGFGILHYMVQANNFEGFKLLKEWGADLDIMSQNHLTPIMIASNYGFVEIAKFLIDNGCSLDARDGQQFTPLLHALTRKQHKLFFYILLKQPQLSGLIDSNNCSVVHWAAFNNDVFLLRFFQATSVQFDLFDRFGFTPLGRATQNHAYQAVKYLINEFPDMLQYPYEIDQNSKYIKYICQKKYFEYKLKLHKINIPYKIQIVTFILVGLQLIELLVFVNGSVQETVNDTYFGMLNNLIYIITIIFCIFYTIWFMLKTPSHQNEGVKLLSKIQSRKPQQEKKEEMIEKQLLIEKNENENDQKQKQKKESKPSQKQQQQQKQMNISMNMNSSLIVVNKEEQTNLLKEDEEEEEKEDQESQMKTQETYKTKTIESPYSFQQTPKFLQDISLKEFLSIDYREVEQFLDTMKHKPPQYFKFANNITQYKEEINQLLEINDPLWYTAFTILHMIYFLYESNRLRAIHFIDWERVCPTCLQYKMPRTVHCKDCKQCVKDYHLHSKLLGKCINSTNHLFYAVFILSLPFVIFYFVLYYWIHFSDKVSSYFLIAYQCYWVIPNGFEAFMYFLNLISLPYLSMLSLVEIACIFYNLTYNELFNSARYRYLYEPVLLTNGTVYLRWKRSFPQGIMRNLLYYLANQVRNLKLL